MWFFFDNPAVGLTEAARLFLEAFAASAQRQPRLRLVIAGFETLSLAGTQFQSPPIAGAASPPGLFVEFLGKFRESDVRDFLTRACEVLKVDPAPAVLDHFVSVALRNQPNQNGDYPRAVLPEVTERLRGQLKELVPE